MGRFTRGKKEVGVRDSVDALGIFLRIPKSLREFSASGKKEKKIYMGRKTTNDIFFKTNKIVSFNLNYFTFN